MKTIVLLLLISSTLLLANKEEPTLTIVDADLFYAKNFWETPAGKAFWETPEGKAVLQTMLEYRNKIENKKP